MAREITYPKNYAFIRKSGKTFPLFVLYLSDDDSLDNYYDVTKEEYDAIIAEENK